MKIASEIITFIIVAFAFAVIVIWKKESIPERARRPLALFALALVISAFALMLIGFFV
jgi:hypothetical protein